MRGACRGSTPPVSMVKAFVSSLTEFAGKSGTPRVGIHQAPRDDVRQLFTALLAGRHVKTAEPDLQARSFRNASRSTAPEVSSQACANS